MSETVLMRPVLGARTLTVRTWQALYRDRWASAFVAICTIATFLLGCYHLGVPSVWGDEAASISIASQNGLALFHSIGRDGGNLAFYYLVLHFVILVFGSGTDTLRLFSVLCATAITPLSFCLGRLLFSRRAGLFCAALTAMSLPILNWAQQIRGYTLVALLLTGSSLALVVAVRDRSTRMFGVYGLLALASCYTELLAGIVIISQFISLALHPKFRKVLKQVALTGLGLVVFLVPLGLIALGRGSSQLFWLGTPNAYSVREDVTFLSSARPNALSISTSHALTELTVILVCVGVVIGIAHALITRRSFKAFGVVLAFLWLVLPPTIAYYISMVYHPVFLDRYFVMCVPALTLLISYALSMIPIMPVAWAGCAVVIGLRAQQLPHTYNISIDEWRTATEVVANETQPGDCIAFYFNDGFTDFAYYLEHPPAGMHRNPAIPRSVLPAIGLGPHLGDGSLANFPAIVESYDTLDSAQIANVEATCPALYLLVNHNGQSSDSTGARLVSSRIITMRDHLQLAYSEMTTDRMRSITIYRFSQANPLVTRSLRSGK